LSIVPANLDLSGAELELAAAMGREFILRDALREWSDAEIARTGRAPADYVLFDCPPSLGLLSINALATAGEVLITMQTEFLALQGMSKLVEVVQLLKKRLNPELVVTGIVPCLYDSRLRLAREVLGEIRTYFRGQVFPHPVRANVKLAEAPSFGQTVFEYAPDSNGADDYMRVAREVIARESRDTTLGELPPFDERARLPLKEVTPPRNPPPRPPPRKPAAKDAPAKNAPENNAPDKAPAAKATTSTLPTAKHAVPNGTESKAALPGAAPSNGAAAANAASKPAESAAKAPTPKTGSTANGAASAERSAVKHSPTTTASVRTTPASPREVSELAPRKVASPALRAAPESATRAAPVQATPAGPERDEHAARERATRDAAERATRDASERDESARAQRDTIVPRAPVARPPARPEPRVLRAEDVPPLPPDAFEILSILPTDT
jgi:hypothetical protein